MLRLNTDPHCGRAQQKSPALRHAWKHSVVYWQNLPATKPPSRLDGMLHRVSLSGKLLERFAQFFFQLLVMMKRVRFTLRFGRSAGTSVQHAQTVVRDDVRRVGFQSVFK